MHTRSLTRRSLCIAAAALIVQLPAPRVARADIWGGDIPLLTTIVANTTQTVSQLVSVITNLQQQVTMMNAMLAHFDPVVFESVISLMNRTQLTYYQLTHDASSIEYAIQNVDAQFRGAYGRSYAAMPTSQFATISQSWQTEILGAAQVATRSQTALATAQLSTIQTAQILRNAEGADSIVAQLQAILQVLHVIATQNNTLIQSLVTMSRVLSSTAAGGASQQQLSTEKKSRNLQGYRDRGAAVVAMTSLP